jgi:hypothetical protein
MVFHFRERIECRCVRSTFFKTATHHGEEGSSIIHENVGISLLRVRKQELGLSGCVAHNAMEWSIAITVFCIGIRTMIHEELDQSQLGAMASPASSVQGRTLVVTALRMRIDVGSRFTQLLCKKALILERLFFCLDRSILSTNEEVWSHCHRPCLVPDNSSRESSVRSPYYLPLM